MNPKEIIDEAIRIGPTEPVEPAEPARSRKFWHRDSPSRPGVGLPIKRADARRPVGLSGRQRKKARKAARRAAKEGAEYASYPQEGEA